jgi:non-lysosomal glucosylceramidase
MNKPSPVNKLVLSSVQDSACGSAAGGGCGPIGCCGPIDRRTFLKWSGVAAAAASVAGMTPIAGPFAAEDVRDHFVPADKKLTPEWLAQLTARGQRTWYSGKDLETIGMPVGGICAGQLYLAGDGRLVHWDLFNEPNFTGYGATNYEVGRQPAQGLEQGFALRVESAGKSLVRRLDCAGFPGVRFCGEYPLGFVDYADAEVPIHVQLQAFSPFIPLDAADSALPATVLQFTLKNTSSQPATVTLAGWLENGVCLASGREMPGTRVNRVQRRDGLTMVVGRAQSAPSPTAPRPPLVLADFEGRDYGDWQAEGEAFGTGPAQGTLDGQQPVSGFVGKGLVNTYLGGNDQKQGKLTSPPFTIDRAWISFLIGGGEQAGKTCINLIVDGKAVLTAHGKNNEKLTWHNWDVRPFQGKQATIQIVDAESGPWGHVNVDQIELRDAPQSARSGPLDKQNDFGTMGLALLGGKTEISDPPSEIPQSQGAGDRALPTVAADALPDALFADADPTASPEAAMPFSEKLLGAVSRTLPLAPGQETTVTFVVAWHFPNRADRGHFYATRFNDAGAVAQHVATNLERLAGQTRLWHDTWYDSTLPHWLLDRLFSTVSTLATGTCQWWANGRFWAWEGVGCCHGTCTHVWNYEHGMARLFPQLERSAREMQDYHPEAGFVEETGMVRFRGEGWNMWAADGQAGTVLKAYREHLVSPDDQFLRRLWPRVRKSLEFLIREDGDGDGLIEGSQHNTYDINFFGPNTMVGSLYLAALRAGEEMARSVDEAEFAATCRKIFEAGSRLTVEKLFDGEYFVQKVDLARHPKHQYADGCLADQLFGQGWAHQVALGYVYPEDKIRAALAAIWKYCWAPDVGPQNEVHPPQRWFARPGEAGLFTCTWPKSKHLGPESVLYRDEVWTGIEYQVAGNMVWDGMLTEALAICRAVHERYHPAKHNPWNEIECGDHYARGMASHGVFLALCGFEYDGPQGQLGFAPRLTPEDFRAAFTAAESWGTFSQKRQPGAAQYEIAVRWGRLNVRTLALQMEADAKPKTVRVTRAGQELPAQIDAQDGRLRITLREPIAVSAGESIQVEVTA